MCDLTNYVYLCTLKVTYYESHGKKRLPKPNQSNISRQANHKPMACRADGCDRHDRITLENKQDTAIYVAVRRNFSITPC